MALNHNSTSPRVRSPARQAEFLPPITSIGNPLEHAEALWPGFAQGRPFGNKSVLRNRSLEDGRDSRLQLVRRSGASNINPSYTTRCDELLFVRSNTTPTERAADIQEIKDYLTRLDGQEDKFISINTFFGRRQHKNLKALTAIVVDLDLSQALSRGHDYKGDFIRLRQDAMDLLSGAGIPIPNFTVHSGKGVHLYWLFDQIVPAAAFPRWRSCLTHLIELLANVGADESVKDSARVLRLVGTINTKAPVFCRRVTSEIFRHARYSFDFLADQILPFTRSELDALRLARKNQLAELGPMQAKARATVRSVGDPTAPTKRGRRYSATAIDRLGDLTQLAKTLHPNGVEEGKRDKYLFAASVHLAWICRAETLEQEILRWKNDHVASMSDEEARATMGTLMNRAQEAYQDIAVGCHKSVFDDARYVLSAKTLWEQFGADITQAGLVDQMKGIVPAGVLQERKREAQKAKSADHYTGMGIRKSNLDRARQAHELKGQGITVKEISDQLQIAPKTVYAWLAVEPTSLGLPAAVPPPLTDPAEVLVEAKSYPQAKANTTLLPKSSLNNGEARQFEEAPSSMAPALRQKSQKNPEKAPEQMTLLPGVAVVKGEEGRDSGGQAGGLTANDRQGMRMWKHPGEKVVALRQLPIELMLTRLGLHHKIDRSYAPKGSSKSERVHVTLNGGFVVELVYTGLLWIDKTQGPGGFGSIDLAMHLKGWSLRETLAELDRQDPPPMAVF